MRIDQEHGQKRRLLLPIVAQTTLALVEA